MNPLQIAMELLNRNKGTPIANNLSQMVQNGNVNGIEQLGRNMMKEQGRDFDKEFAEFKRRMGVK